MSYQVADGDMRTVVHAHRGESCMSSTEAPRAYENLHRPGAARHRAMHAYLTRSYWSPEFHTPRSSARRAIRCASDSMKGRRRAGRSHARGHRPRHVRLPLRCVRARGHRGRGLGKS
jgi:hypothetical protein